MAAGKEIRGKIKSVENTKKITKAMEMVAASKMRKAQERMRSARPYSEKIRTVAAHLASQSGVHAPVSGQARQEQENWLYCCHHRQRPVRRHEYQHLAASDAQDERAGNGG